MRSFDLPSGTFVALERGPQAGPVILCLHGFPDHPPSFGPLMERLGEAGYRVVAPYMRGYAPSTRAGPYDLDRLSADLVEMAEVISPEAPIAVVGHDWGAAALYPAIAARPDRFFGAVAMSVPHPLTFLKSLGRRPAQLARSWYMLFFQLPAIPERVMARNDFAFVDALWRLWSPGYEPSPASMRQLKQTLAASMPAPIAYYRALARPLVDSIRTRSLAATAAGLEVPTLYLHGTRDGCISDSASRGQQSLFRGPFEARLVEGAGHFLQIERPDAVAAQIVPWFNRYGPFRSRERA